MTPAPELPKIDHELVDLFEQKLTELPEIDLPVRHYFTQRIENLPGMYIRQIFMPAGAALTSKIHKTEHPYMVLQGKALVCTEGSSERVLIQAPCWGLTPPNTRRMLLILEDTIWVTFHPTNRSTVEDVEKDIIEARENPLLGGSYNALGRLGS